MKTGIVLAACVALSLSQAMAALAQMQHGAHGVTATEMKIAVEGAWARASVGRNGAAFVTLINKGDTDDRLVAAKSDVSPRVELHTHLMDGNVMRMRQLDAIPVAVGETVTLKPGGLHVMIIGLKKKLVEGETFPLTLVFEKAGEVTVSVPIKKVGAMGGDHGGHSNSMGGTKH